MKKSILTGALSFLIMIYAGAAFAQCKEVVWPENPEMKAKAEESKVLYEDAVRAGQPKELKAAIAPLSWMLKNVPNHHVSLYITGADLFDKLAAAEKDPARKKVYIDSLMTLYDLRIKACGDESNVMNRKALSFVKFNANDKPAESLQMLDKVIELNGNNISDGALVPYMQVLAIHQAKVKPGFTDEQILQRFEKIISIIDAKTQKAQSEGKPIDKFVTMKTQSEELLTKTGMKIDCDFVKKSLEPKYRKNPKDLVLGKQIFTYMLQGKCTEDPLWLEVAEQIHTSGEKNCGLAKNLGKIYMSKENFAKAAQYLKESQELCTDAADKGEILLLRGQMEAVNGSKSAARDLYRQAASVDPSLQKEVYEKIGDLYLTSFDTCKKLVSKVEDRLVFLIAYDYYQRAGNTKKMAQAKDNFPSKEEIFTEGIDAGSSKTLNSCWVGESTTIRTRD
jgi:tetratricopeptide (TPR) repeat protein